MSDETPETPREGDANRHPEDDRTGEFDLPSQPRSASEHVNTTPTRAVPTTAADADGEESADESIAVARDGEATVQHPRAEAADVERADAEPADAEPTDVEPADAGTTDVEEAPAGPAEVEPVEAAPAEVEPARSAPAPSTAAIVGPAAGPEAEPEPGPEAEPAPHSEPAHPHPVTEAYDEAPRTGPAWAPEPPAAGAAPGATAAAATATATGTGATAAAGPAQPSGPVYVTAPTPPKRRGNRGAGILIALLATLVFAIVDALVVLAIFALNQQGNVLDDLLRYIATPAFWATAIIYALALFLLVAIANRGGWWWYVLGGFLVAVVVYFAYIGATLLTNAWVLAPSEVGRFVSQLWSHPLTIATAVVAREVTIWFGAWIAARGRRVRARNLEAREAYDREVAAHS